MSDEEHISARTWTRAVDPIDKIGYMDGAADGQVATFQKSFDTGYEQGMSFGLKLGFAQAVLSGQSSSSDPHLSDPRRINCQVCLHNSTAQENVVNLFNNQKEKNYLYLQKTNKSDPNDT